MMSCQSLHSVIFLHFLKNARYVKTRYIEFFSLFTIQLILRNNHAWRTTQHLVPASRRSQSTAVNTGKIVIPKRIPRSPTDILQVKKTSVSNFKYMYI